jgi:hypothetical protein
MLGMREILQLSSKLAYYTEELRETEEKLQRSLSERTSWLEKMKKVMKNETFHGGGI